MRRLHRWLSGRDEAPELVVAQARALSQQIPMLHAIVSLNAIALAYTHYGIAPASLTVLPLSLLLCLCAGRMHVWSRARHREIDPGEAVRRLTATTRLAGILGLVVTGWALLLTRYGDIGTHMHVLSFLTLTMIACIACLTHLRSASMIIAAIGIPAALYFIVDGTTVLRAAALNYGAILLVMLYMQSVYDRDFRRLSRLISENGELAHTDTLTGLPNRRAFFTRLEETIARAKGRDDRFTIGVIDLDGFKPVNDTFGHHAGDAVLREVSRRLQEAVAGHGWAARLGGDEFGLILDGRADLDTLGRAACATIGMPYALGNAMAQIGASIGFARFPESARDLDVLVERADYALYHVKASTPGSAICFAPEHEDRLRRHAVIEQALRRADVATEFTLAFQPIIDVLDERVEAYEALARWTSPTLGSVSPADFILVAERAGLIQDLSLVLLGKALAAMRDWPASVRLSFNLSALDIASPEAIARLTDLIAASGIAPDRIVFEVTETRLMRDLVDARRSLAALQAFGVGIALDDFGTGYSSLSYVHRLPISELKIDRSFVLDICTDPASLNIIRSILDLCRHLDLDCVVEGVETEGQMRLLRAAGCRLMQGYLFHRPMPQAEAAAFLVAPCGIRTVQAA